MATVAFTKYRSVVDFYRVPVCKRMAEITVGFGLNMVFVFCFRNFPIVTFGAIFSTDPLMIEIKVPIVRVNMAEITLLFGNRMCHLQEVCHINAP